MELQEFIVNAMLEINDALVEIKERSGQDFRLGHSRTDHHPGGGKVSFDVAVVQSGGSEVSGKGNAGIHVVGVGVEGKLHESDQQTSRLKFDLSLYHVADIEKSRRK